MTSSAALRINNLRRHLDSSDTVNKVRNMNFSHNHHSYLLQIFLCTYNCYDARTRTLDTTQTLTHLIIWKNVIIQCSYKCRCRVGVGHDTCPTAKSVRASYLFPFESSHIHLWSLKNLYTIQHGFDMQHTGVNAVGASSINVKVSSEVSEALSLGRAVVALESTIISHGILYLFIWVFVLSFSRLKPVS